MPSDNEKALKTFGLVTLMKDKKKSLGELQ
jgi:hypothetical protein